ncbi:RNA polymerase subunit sigma-70 [Streptomyces sp. NPDC090025]|uniref:RNA polymerase subunit sigma-70 n=1 Tax=Streptomyces sp. NPDC090025 TaxID=3365922 RepID=UPI0038359DDC
MDERLRPIALRLLGEDGAEGLPPSLDGVPELAAVCLDRLRAREADRSVLRDPGDPWDGWESGPEDVLDAMAPSERLAFVLHEEFAVPYETIAPVVGLTPAGTRQLVGRARRRMEGTAERPAPDPERQRAVVSAFLTAARAADGAALLALLDPDVVLRADATAVRNGAVPAHGARAVAHRVSGRLRDARPAEVAGAAGLVWEAADGEPKAALRFTVLEDRVTAVDALADPPHLSRLLAAP